MQSRYFCYLREFSTYGESFARRQFSALDFATDITRYARSAGTAKPPHFLRRLDQRITNATTNLTKAHLGDSIIGSVALGVRLRDAEGVYTVFGWNALDVHFALRRAGNRSCRVAFHLAGSDVTAASVRGSLYIQRLIDASNSAALVLCGSNYIRERATELGLDPSRLKVHYMGTPIPNQARQAPPDRPTFVTVSRLHPVKGVTYAVQAYAQAASQLRDAQLIIIGDGPERSELESLVRAAHIPNVTFMGEVSPSVVQRHLLSATALVQHNVPIPTGAEEALGGSIIEASAAGLPVIGTSSGGVPEAVINGRTGLLCRPTDVDAMSEAMVVLATDASTNIRMGSAGRSHVGEVHNASIQDALLRDHLLRAYSLEHSV